MDSFPTLSIAAEFAVCFMLLIQMYFSVCKKLIISLRAPATSCLMNWLHYEPQHSRLEHHIM